MKSIALLLVLLAAASAQTQYAKISLHALADTGCAVTAAGVQYIRANSSAFSLAFLSTTNPSGSSPALTYSLIDLVTPTTARFYGGCVSAPPAGAASCSLVQSDANQIINVGDCVSLNLTTIQAPATRLKLISFVTDLAAEIAALPTNSIWTRTFGTGDCTTGTTDVLAIGPTGAGCVLGLGLSQAYQCNGASIVPVRCFDNSCNSTTCNTTSITAGTGLTCSQASTVGAVTANWIVRSSCTAPTTAPAGSGGTTAPPSSASQAVVSFAVLAVSVLAALLL